MKIDSPRFGTLDIDPDRIIDFPAGLAGFPELRRFSLFHPDGGEHNYFILQSLEDPAVAFHIADPARFGIAYEITLSDAETLLIGLDDPEAAAVAVMLIKDNDDGTALRANQNAPLVINVRSRQGFQYVLDRSRAVRREVIATAAAPAAIGTYSQAVRAGNTLYLSGQIGLDPATQQLVEGIDAQIVRVFDNLKAVAEAAGSRLNDAVKLTVYLTDLGHYPRVNEIMARYFNQPYPARAVVGVKELPRGALVEADAILVLG